MKLFKVYLGLFAIVILFVLGSRFFPSTYDIRESIVINKPVNETFHYMSNLKNWEDWGLWDKSQDSTLYFFYSPKQDTVGARQYISGKLMGKGHIEVVHYENNKKLDYRLWLMGGEVTAAGKFAFTELPGNQTELTWIDSGDVGNNPIKRYMVPSKKESTRQAFKEGLLRIKASAEKH